MLVFAFRSEIWIVQNFSFTVFKDFCLSLSWKYRFLQNVNHAKVQSKTNKYCKFHVDLTRRRLSNSRFQKLGMVPKKLYRNTLKVNFAITWKNLSPASWEHGPSVFIFANSLFWRIIFSFTYLYGLINLYVLYRKRSIDLLVSQFALKRTLVTRKCWPGNRDYMVNFQPG